MKTKLLFLVFLLLLVSPKPQLQADNLISAVYYEKTPPVERAKKPIVKKKHKKKLFKKRTLRQKHKLNQTEKLNKPGFIALIIIGVLLGILAFFLFQIMPSGLGCTFGAIFITLLAWTGWVILALLGLAGIIAGIILLVILNSRKYLDRKKRHKEAREAEQEKTRALIRQDIPNISDADADIYAKNKKKIPRLKTAIKAYQERKTIKGDEKATELNRKLHELVQQQKEIEEKYK